MNFTIERIYKKDEWQAVLGHCTSFDFSHTYDFHRISQLNGEGDPILFTAKSMNGEYIACWPLLQRKIPDSHLFDYSSVYAYGGPLFMSTNFRSEAIQAILCNIEEAGAVSIFSRMHPLYIEGIPDEPMRGTKLGQVVVVDVMNNNLDHISSYRSGHRYEIRKSKKLGVDTLIDQAMLDIDDFVEIYRQSMLDVGASSYYMFTPEYFNNLARCNDFKVFLIYACLGGVKISAAMFIVTKDVMQYYLSGTVDSYKKYAPSKLIIATAHQMAIDLGLKWLVLGGGVGSKQDALYEFKKGFSDCDFPYYVFKKILNESAYKSLCQIKGIDASKDFFPAYRAIQ